MRQTVSHRELRNRSGEILRRAAGGESILVTNNGVAAAVIGPPPTSVIDSLIERGQARPASRPTSDLGLISRVTAPLSTHEIIADVRGHW